MKRTTVILVALLFLLIPLSLFAQSGNGGKGGNGGGGPDSPSAPLIGSITDGNVTFGFTDFAASDGGAYVDFEVPTGTPHMYAGWWWYRVSGDTSETVFPPPDTENYTGNVATLTWGNVNGRGFSAILVATVTDTAGGAGTSGTVQEDLTITNNSGSDLLLDMVTFADFDLGGTTANSASLNTANNIIDITDGAGTTGQFSSNFVTMGAYDVQTWSSLSDALDDTAVTNFGNSGLPFGPDDFTGAFQDDTRTISNGGSVTYTTGYAVNTLAPTALTLQQVSAKSSGTLSVYMAIMVLLVGMVALLQQRR